MNFQELLNIGKLLKGLIVLTIVIECGLQCSEGKNAIPTKPLKIIDYIAGILYDNTD
ncbi:hypothetical protein PSKAS_22820 [Peribacillus sp. N1]